MGSSGREGREIPQTRWDITQWRSEPGEELRQGAPGRKQQVQRPCGRSKLRMAKEPCKPALPCSHSSWPMPTTHHVCSFCGSHGGPCPPPSTHIASETQRRPHSAHNTGSADGPGW
uniref:Uncharacterized protein n=1 Tax=Mustela putorius furo TaxID=9669 RepID=M3XSA7_MUSPF